MVDAVPVADRPAAVSPDAPAVTTPPARTTIGPSWWRRWLLAAPFVVVPLLGVYGVVLRAWLLAHLAVMSDEAVVGIMGRAITSGTTTAFYWGQHYGGAEPYVVAGVLKGVNDGPVGLGLAPMLLAVVAAGLVVACVLEATGNGRLAALAGAMAWVWPYSAVWNSVREIGFRGVTLACGLVMVLCALAIQRRTERRLAYLFLGLAAGTGWWASPEIVYFVPPVAVLLLAAWDRPFEVWRQRRTGAAPGVGDPMTVPSDRAGPRRPPLVNRLVGPALVVLGFAVGALPWIDANVRSGFASVRSGALPPYLGEGYGTRLSIFFHDTLPIALGVRGVPGGSWVGGPVLGPVLFALGLMLLAAALVRALWLARLGRRCATHLALALGVLAFPLEAAAVPTSGYWFDGRYGVFLGPLVVVLLALAVAGPPRLTTERPGHFGARHRGRPAVRRATWVAPLAVGAASLVAVGAGASTVAAARESGGVPATPGAFFSGWSDPNAAARTVVANLERHHIRQAFGDYWTAYVLDFLSGGHVAVAPSLEEVNRERSLMDEVARSPSPAWLFTALGQAVPAYRAFDNGMPGPDGWSEAQFVRLLESQGVSWRIVHLGVLDAVVPARKVGLPGLPPTG
ncbi:MAG TPA: hypothetical protein VKG43_10200 [Acidimicrobiales bacterium]|nr:hypothetical protein [Acidimicrobiales bacterium]